MGIPGVVCSIGMRLVDRLREAREARGLSQHDVAVAMRSTQPAIARLENARVDPRLGTLERYAEVVGVRIASTPLGRADVPATGRAIEEAVASGDRETALRHVVQLVDDLGSAPRSALDVALRQEPALTGDRRFDAILAAACERAAHRAGLPAPGWTAAPSRLLDVWWFPIEDLLGRLPEGLACLALAASPAEFSIRGIFLDPEVLESV